MKILQIILLILLKTPNQGHLKHIFHSKILWNLEVALLILPGTKLLSTAPGSLTAV